MAFERCCGRLGWPRGRRADSCDYALLAVGRAGAARANELESSHKCRQRIASRVSQHEAQLRVWQQLIGHSIGLIVDLVDCEEKRRETEDSTLVEGGGVCALELDHGKQRAHTHGRDGSRGAQRRVREEEEEEQHGVSPNWSDMKQWQMKIYWSVM